MRRKLLIGAGVLLALVAVAVIALSVVVKTYLKSDKLKAIIIPKAEEFTGRTVELDRIDVSLFKGVVLKGLTVKEGQGDFVSVQEFVLAYDLLPLLRKQLVIRKIVLVSPQVRIMRLSEDRYNFSDILERASGGEGPAKEAKPEDGGLPVSIVAQRVVVEDARVEFADAMKEIPDFTARGDANLDISMEKGRPRAEGRVELKELSAELRGVRTEARGRLDITRDSLKADLRRGNKPRGHGEGLRHGPGCEVRPQGRGARPGKADGPRRSGRQGGPGKGRPQGRSRRRRQGKPPGHPGRRHGGHQIRQVQGTHG
ncbi:MAG: AsmA family protein [Nitrospirota bacterium]